MAKAKKKAKKKIKAVKETVETIEVKDYKDEELDEYLSKVEEVIVDISDDIDFVELFKSPRQLSRLSDALMVLSKAPKISAIVSNKLVYGANAVRKAVSFIEKQ